MEALCPTYSVFLSIRVFNIDQKLPFCRGKFFSVGQNSGFDLKNSWPMKQFLQVLQLTGQRSCFNFQESLWLFELFIDI